MITATTPIEFIVAPEDAPVLPELPRITPRLRVPVRVIGRPHWDARTLDMLAQGVVHPDQHTTNGAIATPELAEVA